MSGPADPPPFGELVAAAMKASGAANGGQLADALGYVKRNEGKKVDLWATGKSQAGYEGTMKLLYLAGWLTEEKRARPQPALVPTRLNLAAEVQRLAELLEAFLAAEAPPEASSG